jgi:TolA-binding protein
VAATEAEIRRGMALARLGLGRAARQSFRRVIELDKGQLAAQARIAQGRLFLEEGDGESALSEFLKVALLYAHSEEVAEALFLSGELLEARGERDAALARYREAADQHAETAFGRSARKRLSEIEE